jgi:hypothetical protein
LTLTWFLLLEAQRGVKASKIALAFQPCQSIAP